MDGGHRYRGCAVLTILLISFSLQTALVISQDCTYLYIEQPPADTDIDCNPYLGFRTDEMLVFQCALRAPVGSNVNISWYHNGSVQMNGASDLPVQTNDVEGIDTFRSSLTLSDPQPANDSGDYYCQAAVDGMNLLPSETFTLSGDQFEYINFRECVGVDRVSFSITDTKCADIPPTTTAAPTESTSLPTPSQTTLPTTVTPSQSRDSQPGLGLTTQLPPTLPSTNADGTTPTSDAGSDPNMTPNGSLQVWIYVLVGVAAVFGMIIVILTIMCVGLCVRRNKTQDSHTLKRAGGTGLTLGSMVSNGLYNSTDENLNLPGVSAHQPSLPPYSSLSVPPAERVYDTVAPRNTTHQGEGYAHLHRPSPPPLPSTLPNGRSATMTEKFRSTNTLGPESLPEPDFSPPSLPPKGTVPDHHVYRELENPISYSPNGSSPPLSAGVFERGDSSTQLLPNGPFSKANGGPYRKFSSDSATPTNESLYSPTTPIALFSAANCLEGIPETGMSFVEPDDPSAFPVHEYEVIPGNKRRTKNYESPVPDQGYPIGGNAQTRLSVKSANYETDPQLEVALPEKSSTINPYDSTCHFSASAAELSRGVAGREFRKVGEPAASTPVLSPPPTQNGGVASSDYSRLNFKHSSHSRPASKDTELLDADFFKNASEIRLTGNGMNTHKKRFSNSSGGSTLYDSEESSRENSPFSNSTRGQSVPLAPPPVYPTECKYNQLTLPGFHSAQYPVCAHSKTTV